MRSSSVFIHQFVFRILFVHLGNANTDLLHDCDFFDVTKDVIWKLPPECTYFHGRGYPIGGYEVGLKLGEAVRFSTALRTVDLGGSVLGDEGLRGLLEHVDDSVPLEALFLGSNQITVNGARYIAEMLRENTRLKKLDLGFNRLMDGGAKVIMSSLKYHCAMETLILEGNGIADGGSSAIATALANSRCFPNGLKHLHIGGNKITSEGAVKLAKSLALDPPLVHLDLGYNSIGNAGMSAICTALQSNINLKILDVEYNQIVGNSWHNISKSDGGGIVIDTVKLRQNEINIASIVQFMEGCRGLRNLDLGGCHLNNFELGVLAASIQDNLYLRNVAVDGNEITDESANLLVEAVIYRSCRSRPVEIKSDFININEVALRNSRSCKAGVLMDGKLQHHRKEL